MPKIRENPHERGFNRFISPADRPEKKTSNHSWGHRVSAERIINRIIMPDYPTPLREDSLEILAKGKKKIVISVGRLDVPNKGSIPVAVKLEYTNRAGLENARKNMKLVLEKMTRDNLAELGGHSKQAFERQIKMIDFLLGTYSEHLFLTLGSQFAKEEYETMHKLRELGIPVVECWLRDFETETKEHVRCLLVENIYAENVDVFRVSRMSNWDEFKNGKDLSKEYDRYVAKMIANKIGINESGRQYEGNLWSATDADLKKEIARGFYVVRDKKTGLGRLILSNAAQLTFDSALHDWVKDTSKPSNYNLPKK